MAKTMKDEGQIVNVKFESIKPNNSKREKIALKDLIKTYDSLFNPIKKRQKESLIDVMLEIDQRVAKQIEEKGLPEYVFCGKEVYPLLKHHISFLNIEFREALEPNQSIFSWDKHDILSWPTYVLNTEVEDGSGVTFTVKGSNKPNIYTGKKS
jgi:hypothetical protein